MKRIKRINTTCPCGATLEMESDFYADLSLSLGQWQTKHQGHTAASQPTTESPTMDNPSPAQESLIQRPPRPANYPLDMDSQKTDSTTPKIGESPQSDTNSPESGPAAPHFLCVEHQWNWGSKYIVYQCQKCPALQCDGLIYVPVVELETTSSLTSLKRDTSGSVESEPAKSGLENNNDSLLVWSKIIRADDVPGFRPDLGPSPKQETNESTESQPAKPWPLHGPEAWRIYQQSKGMKLDSGAARPDGVSQ